MVEVWTEVQDLFLLGTESSKISEEDWVDERTGKKWHGMVLEMPVQKGDTLNQNRRKYPWKNVLKPALEDYNTTQVNEGMSYLHGDHNDPAHEDPTVRKVNPLRTAGLMVQLECDDKKKLGVAKIRVLNNLAGQTVKEMWAAGGRIGVSSVSKIVAEQATDDEGAYEVAKKMKLLGFDLIINPSVKEAVPTQVSFERKEEPSMTPDELEAAKKAKEVEAEALKAKEKAEAEAKKKKAKEEGDEEGDEDEEDEFVGKKKKKKGKKVKDAEELRQMYPDLVGEIETEAVNAYRMALREIAEVLAGTGIVERSSEDETAEQAISGLKEKNSALEEKVEEMEREDKLRRILSGFTAEEQEKVRSMLEGVPTYALEDRAAPVLELLKEKNEAEEAAKTATEQVTDSTKKPAPTKTTETSKTETGKVATEGLSNRQKMQRTLALD